MEIRLHLHPTQPFKRLVHQNPTIPLLQRLVYPLVCICHTIPTQLYFTVSSHTKWLDNLTPVLDMDMDMVNLEEYRASALISK